jgi:hypothetical protein
MNLPTIGIVVHFLSTAGHPPKPTVYSHNSSNPPTLFPATYTTQKNLPPSLLIVHRAIQFIYQGFHYTQLARNLSIASGGLKTSFTRILSYFLNRKHTTGLQPIFMGTQATFLT